MTNEQRKGLRPLFMGLGAIIFFAGALTDIYPTEVGLLIALAIWVLAGPLIKLLGFGTKDVSEKKPDAVEEERSEKKEKEGGGKLLLALVIIILLFWAFSKGSLSKFNLRGSGVVVKEDREVSDFSQVEVQGSGNLMIDQSGEEGLVIEAEDNIISRIDTKVSGDTLIISMREPWLLITVWPTRDVNYYLSVDDMNSIGLSGSGKIVADSLSGEDLKININGSGKTEMSLEVNSLEVDVSGSGKFDMAGKANDQQININGSGNYDAKDLESENVKIIISGSGGAIVNAREDLDVKISGSGKIQYLGEPKVSQNISGSGSVVEYLGSQE